MAQRKQTIVNFHGATKDGLEAVASSLEVGEIAVVTQEALLAIQNSDKSKRHYFVDSATTSSAINEVKETLTTGKADKVGTGYTDELVVFGEGGNIASSDKTLDSYVSATTGSQLFAETDATKLAGIKQGATRVEKSAAGDEKNKYIKINGDDIQVWEEVEGTVHDADYKHITVTETSVSNGVNTLTKASTAAEIAVTDASGITSNNVQSALAELAGKITAATVTLDAKNNSILALDETTRTLSSTIGLTLKDSGNTKYIVLSGVAGELGAIDTADFVKDGMVSNISLDGNTLKITWNGDAGKTETTIDLSDYINTYSVKAESENYLGVDNDAKKMSVKTSDLAADATGLARYNDVTDELAGKVDTATTIAGISLNDNIEAATLTGALDEAVSGASGKQGLMSASDKAKIDGIASGATANDLVDVVFGTVETAAAASTQDGVKASAISDDKKITLDFTEMIVDCGTF